MTSRPVRVVLLGLGAINTRVAELLHAREADFTVVGVARRSTAMPALPALACAKRITDSSELTGLSPDVILEAASREAVREWGGAALGAAKRVILSSTSALADDDLRNRLIEAARRQGSYLVLSPGASAGMDALTAAATLQIDEVCHRIVKPPQNWPAAADQNASIDQFKPRVLFSGSARDAADRYPQNANVTVVTALAGIGLDKTRVELVSDPTATSNRHEIRAKGDFGSLNVTIENQPLRSNPKSSELAALALVRLAKNERPGIVL